MAASGGDSQNMKELLDRFEVYAKASGFADAYIQHMRRCVGYFDDFLGGHTDAGKVTADDFRLYQAYLRDRPVWGGLKGKERRAISGTTINTYARAVKAFFSWLKEEGIIAVNPLAEVPAAKKPKTLPRIYSKNELETVFKAAAEKTRYLAVLCLYLDSGMRLAEMVKIDMVDIDIPEGTIRVHGKGGKERPVFFKRVTGAVIDDYVKHHRPAPEDVGRLFLADDGHPLSKSGIQSLLERLGRKAGLKKRLAPHLLRHTMATMSVNSGANLEFVKRILGHTDVKTTSESYLNLQDADVKAAHQKFSPLANLQSSSLERYNLPDQEDGGNPETIPMREADKKAGENKLSGGASRNSGQETPQKPIKGISETNHDGTQPTIMANETKDALRAVSKRRYMEHMQKLSHLAKELIADIENGNLELPGRPAKTNPKSMFGGLALGRVYRAQNKPLWPFLLQHLNNEFHDPTLGGQLAQIATAAFWTHHLKKELYDPSPADLVREKLLLVSERGTFKGTCTICEGYFNNDSNK